MRFVPCCYLVSTHSRPKAAGCWLWPVQALMLQFQHTAARRRLGRSFPLSQPLKQFQHTAARRRLGHAANLHAVPVLSFNTQPPEGGWLPTRLHQVQRWFQHTAARRRLAWFGANHAVIMRFNTQPPEGGWINNIPICHLISSFNTQPPEGGWSLS